MHTLSSGKTSSSTLYDFAHWATFHEYGVLPLQYRYIDFIFWIHIQFIVVRTILIIN